MNPVTNANEALARITELGKTRDGFIGKKGGIDSKLKQAEEEHTRLLEELKEKGTSPETIEADITREVKALVDETNEYDTAMTAFGSVLDQAEREMEVFK
jgi:hypothetical protein